MNIVGIDNSINSPGVVWFNIDDKTFEIKSTNFLGFTTVKKDATENIIHYKKVQFSDGIHQYLWMRDTIYDTIISEIEAIPDYVAFEDYAFAAKGKVFNIAESTGALKVKFYSSKVPIRLYDPASIKLFSTGFGNADKIRMCQEYDKLDSIEKLKGFVNEDIVDAFFICSLLYTELKIRKGFLSLYTLPEEKIKVFNRVTKSYPDNLLVRDFIQAKE